MKTISKFLLLIVLPLTTLAQEQVFKSAEMEDYLRRSKFKSFTPPSNEEILNYQKEFFTIEDLFTYTPFSDSFLLTPYQEKNFSVFINPIKSGEIIVRETQFIGKIRKSQVLIHEKKGKLEAILYECFKFGDLHFGEPGIWVAFSEDAGLNWEYLYTGIVQKQPLYLKWYSKPPLFKTGRTLQVEASLHRRLEPTINPGYGLDYEVVKDGLLLILSLDSLQKDTDSDGLTDIVELKFNLNPKNNDTDSDGIYDNLDLNPRFSLLRTNETILYETVLNDASCFWDTAGFKIYSNTLPDINHAKDSTETFLIVSDNPVIQSIQPHSKRVIILTEREYKEQKRLFDTELIRMNLSPLLRVDNETGTYLLLQSSGDWSRKFIVRRTEQGFKIWLNYVTHSS